MRGLEFSIIAIVMSAIGAVGSISGLIDSHNKSKIERNIKPGYVLAKDFGNVENIDIDCDGKYENIVKIKGKPYSIISDSTGMPELVPYKIVVGKTK